MKTKHLIFLLFLPLLAAGQVTFPSPETIATKRYVDSLVTKRLENLGGSEKPEDKPCKAAIELRNITEVSESGLTYQFHSEGVKQLRETIRDASGKVVWTGYTKPTWNTIALVLPAGTLTNGVYKLTISNTDCKAEDTREFAVESGGIEGPGNGDPDPPVGGEGFDNPGVFSEKVGSLLYEWIPSENLDVQIRDGKVRLICPETKQSFDGSNTCRRYLLSDLYDNRLPEAEEKALFGDGLALPPGNYAFKVVYLNASSWKEAHKNMWDMVGVGEGHNAGYQNSGQLETVNLSITDGSAKLEQYRAAWIPQFYYLSDDLKLPTGKAFGVTRYPADIPRERIWKKASHLQYVYSWMDLLDRNKMWDNIQDLRPGGAIAGVDWTVANTAADTGFILLSEYTENCGGRPGANPQDCYNQSEQVFRQLFDRQKREYGITSASQTWLIEDYFSPMYGGSAGVNFEGITKKQRQQGLSSVQYAQSRIFSEEWTECYYFSHGWNQYRGFVANGYMGNIFSMAGQPAFWSRLYNWEKANLAAPNNRKVAYLTNAQEGLHMDIVTLSGSFTRLKMDGGVIMVVNAPTHSLHTFLTETFFSLLYGNGAIIWESSTVLNADPTTFRQSWYGGFEAWKTKWKPNGGAVGTYVPGQNGAPVQKESEGQFPEKPMHGDQGAFLAAKLYEQVQNRVQTLSYPDFEINGKKVKAVRGERGQLLNANGIQNPGQDQIVQAFEKEQPLCILGEGPEGRCVIFQNPWAGLTGASNVLVEGRSLSFVGDRLNVVKL